MSEVENTGNNTDTKVENQNQSDDSKKTENMIPKSRFDQLNQQKKATEQTLQEIAEEFVNDVPEDFRDIVPNLAPAEKIKWIKSAQKKGLFTKPEKKSPDSKTPNKSSQQIDVNNMNAHDLLSQGFKTK